MTIIVDDAGSGDLLFGVVVGAYRPETADFIYRIVDVKFFQHPLFKEKAYIKETARLTLELVNTLKLQPNEEIQVCQGNIFDEAAAILQEVYGRERVRRVKVVGEPQRLTEIAYLDEIRNLGYEPLGEREAKWAKSFFHMMRWLKANPTMLCYAKTGWPRLARYRLFRQFHAEGLFKAVCSECGGSCEVPFKPDPERPVYCKKCWAKKRRTQLQRRRKRV
ncbi:MAG: CxxC-x17-CxxC domain-containing protein [Candidatus Bathyarchaeia archaeon]